MKRALFLAVISAGLVVFLAGQALATVCINISKKDGAGNVGDVIISAVDGSVLQDPTNPGGRCREASRTYTSTSTAAWPRRTTGSRSWTRRSTSASSTR